MAKRLSIRCSKQHVHEPLLAGKAKAAEIYPDQLVLEILRGMRDTADAAHESPETGHCGNVPGAMSQSAALLHDVTSDIAFTFAQQENQTSQRKRQTTLRHADGRLEQVPLHKIFREQYRDEYTDERLPREWVEDAIHDELDSFNDNVWVEVPAD